MKIVLSSLVFLIALHYSSGESSFMSKAKELCPGQNDKIIRMVQDCERKIMNSLHITTSVPNELLYQGYQR